MSSCYAIRICLYICIFLQTGIVSLVFARTIFLLQNIIASVSSFLISDRVEKLKGLTFLFALLHQQAHNYQSCCLLPYIKQMHVLSVSIFLTGSKVKLKTLY